MLVVVSGAFSAPASLKRLLGSQFEDLGNVSGAFSAPASLKP